MRKPTATLSSQAPFCGSAVFQVPTQLIPRSSGRTLASRRQAGLPRSVGSLLAARPAGRLLSSAACFEI